MGKIRNLVGATLVAGFVGGYALSGTIDRTLDSAVNYQPRTIASIVQLGGPDYRLEGFRSEVRRNPPQMKQYSSEFLEIAFMTGMDEEGVRTLYSFVKHDLSRNTQERRQYLVDLGGIAAQNYPCETYEQLPEKEKLEFAKDKLIDYLKEEGGRWRDSIGEILQMLSGMVE